MDYALLAVASVTLLVLLVWLYLWLEQRDDLERQIEASRWQILYELRLIRKAIDQTEAPLRRTERYLRGNR